MTQTQVQPYQEKQPTFNPNEHSIKIPNKGGKADYLPVQWRLVWFREQCPQGTIDTEEIIVDLDKEFEAEVYAWNADTRKSEKTLKRAPGYARFRAIVTDGKGGRATATKSERGVDFPDFVEKAETGAIGRALAALGYGTQFAPELNEEHRIVDAPAERTEDDRRAYRERKPFVESTLKNGDGSPVVIPSKQAQPQAVALSRGDLYTRGEKMGLWSRTAPEKFYAWASAVSGRAQSKTTWDMTLEEMGEMAKQLYEQVPATVSGAN